MKHLESLLFIALLFYGITGYAQHSPIMIGFELGPSMGSLNGEVDKRAIGEKKVGFGFHAGLTAHFSQSEKASLNLGLVFTQKPLRTLWTEVDAGGNEISILSQIPYNFIQLPINGRFYVGTASKYYLDLGGFLSFVISNPGRRLPGRNTIDLSEQLDWGLGFGFGRRFFLKGNQYLSTGFSMDLGLRDVNKFNSIRLSVDSLYSRGLFLKFAYLWPQNK
ncbi:MAG: outer membrane beta-barrel protein [Bacteroidota bacterium]